MQKRESEDTSLRLPFVMSPMDLSRNERMNLLTLRQNDHQFEKGI